MSGASWAILACVGAVVLFKVYMGHRSPEQVALMVEAVASGGLLLDVRSPGEFSGHHLEGALNVPVGELGHRLGELGDKGRAVVVYCASGARSRGAAKLLTASGFEQVHDLGSWRNWP
ncbi:MAG: rhodanese-like domain-containing protein [Myxococcota bacterium]|jgi:rhodanese-related sulfurtransferase|nr:rhodanese-like domain-containing protein [Myxococcota bacterium]